MASPAPRAGVWTMVTLTKLSPEPRSPLPQGLTAWQDQQWGRPPTGRAGLAGNADLAGKWLARALGADAGSQRAGVRRRARPLWSKERSGSARLGQIRRPLRITIMLRTDQPPVHAARHYRNRAEGPAKFFEQPVGLAVVARHTGGDAVLPGVRAAAAARHYVIDRLGPAAAVPAPVVVPAHESGTGQRNPVPVRHPHVPAEPDDGWDRKRDRGCMQHGTRGVVVHHVCLVAEHQADRPLHAQRRHRLIRGVEQQNSSQQHLHAARQAGRQAGSITGCTRDPVCPVRCASATPSGDGRAPPLTDLVTLHLPVRRPQARSPLASGHGAGHRPAALSALPTSLANRASPRSAGARLSPMAGLR